MKNPNQQNDELALWQAFKKGDKEAFGAIYERYAEALFSYGYYFTKDKNLVEDAIQELFVNLWRMKANLSDTTAIKYYLFRALRRKICDLLDLETVFSKLPATHNGVETSIEENIISHEQTAEQHASLSQGLLGLPQRQFQAVHLRFYDNMDTREIAEIMQMNEQSVRNTIQRALIKLRIGFKIFLLLLIIQ